VHIQTEFGIAYSHTHIGRRDDLRGPEVALVKSRKPFGVFKGI